MDRNALYETFSTGFLLTKCSRWILADYQQQVHAFGLTPIQLGILFCLTNSNYNMQRLCDLLAINKTVASRTLKSLRAKGFVSVKRDAQDARCTLYYLNRERWQDIKPHIMDIERTVDAKIARILSQEEQEQLHSLLFTLLSQRDDETYSLSQQKG